METLKTLQLDRITSGIISQKLSGPMCLLSMRSEIILGEIGDNARDNLYPFVPAFVRRSCLSAVSALTAPTSDVRQARERACMRLRTVRRALDREQRETHLSRILQKQPKLEPFGTSLAYDIVISCLAARAHSPSSSSYPLRPPAFRHLFLFRGLPGPSHRLVDVPAGDVAHSTHTYGARPPIFCRYRRSIGSAGGTRADRGTGIYLVARDGFTIRKLK